MSSENHENEKSEEKHEQEWEQGRRRFRRSKLWFIPLILLAVALKGALVMALWNALIPDLFHGPEIKYLQALGLLVLAKVLVGGKGRPGFGGPFGGNHRHGRGGMRGKFWARMSHEERCKLRDHMRKRWKE